MMDYIDFKRRMMMCADTPVTVEGVPPLFLPRSKGKRLKDCQISGNTRRTVTIDGTEYVVPEGITLLDNAGSTATAYYCKRKSDNATGTIDLITGVFTASSFTAGNELPTPDYPLGAKGVGEPYVNIGGEHYPVPEGVRILDKVTFDGATYVQTPLSSYTNKGKFAIEFAKSGATTAFITGQNPDTAQNNIGVFVTSTNGLSAQNGKNTRVTINNIGTSKHTVTMEYGKVTFDGTETAAATVSEFTISQNLYVGAATNTTTGEIDARCFNGDIYSLVHKNASGVTDVAMMGAIQNGVVGMYDFVSETFIAPTGTLTAGNEAEIEYKVTALLAQNCGCVDLGTKNYAKNVHNNDEYFVVGIDGKAEGRNYLAEGYRLASSWNDFWASDMVTYATTSTTVYFRNSKHHDAAAFKSAMSGKHLYFQRTSDASWVAPTPVTIYTDKPLNKVGNYADVLDAIAGLKTDRVGVKVFNGAENWTYSNNGIFRIGIAGSTPQNTTPYVGYCTHFNAINDKTASYISDKQCTFHGTIGNNGRFSVKMTDYNNDLAGFEAFLAAQYAAGTPVTVWYPLAIPVESSQSVPEIAAARGDCYLDILTKVKPSNVKATYIR